MLETLPTVSVVWFGGLVCLLVAITATLVSVRFAGSESGEYLLEQGSYLGSLVVFAWVALGVPLVFVLGGEAAYQSDVGSWTIVIAVLAAAFAYGAISGERNLNSYGERVASPFLFVAFACIPALVLALMMGMITMGAALWFALGAIVVALISFATFGWLAVLVFSPILVLFVIAIAQS